MITNTVKFGLLLLDRASADFYIPSLSNVFRLTFPSDVIADLEVINSQKLQELIKSFFAQNHIPPTAFSLILSQNTLFEKEFADGSNNNEAIEEEKFLSFVPFENILYQKFKLDKNLHVIVTNRDIYESLEKAFQTVSSTIDCICGVTMLGTDVMSLTMLEGQSVGLLLAKQNLIRKYNIIQNEKIQTPQIIEKKKASFVKKKNIMFSIFVLLLFGSAGFMVYYSFLPPARKAASIPIITPTPTILEPLPTATPFIPTLIPTTIPTQSSSSSAREKNTLPVSRTLLIKSTPVIAR